MSDSSDLWVVAKETSSGLDSSVWYYKDGSWVHMPTNRCEGGNLSIRQIVGDNAIAVGTRGLGDREIYVIEAGASPTPSALEQQLLV